MTGCLYQSVAKHWIAAGIIVTRLLINEFPVQLNSFGLFTAVVNISSGGRAQAADVFQVSVSFTLWCLEDTVRYSPSEMYLRYGTNIENCSKYLRYCI